MSYDDDYQDLRLRYGLEADGEVHLLTATEVGWNLRAEAVAEFVSEYPGAIFVIGVHRQGDPE